MMFFTLYHDHTGSHYITQTHTHHDEWCVHIKPIIIIRFGIIQLC